MTREISHDITLVRRGVIGHQTNLQGVMGGGLALQIRKKFPMAYGAYTALISKQKLGDCQIIMVSRDNGTPSQNLYIANLFGQDNFSTQKRETDYDALRSALRKLNAWATENIVEVYLPHGLGCGLAGGDWSIVEHMIEEEVPMAIICRL
jgi:O-acetyl-ADP-ribose deacetylase (regulator of RNase III)